MGRNYRSDRSTNLRAVGGNIAGAAMKQYNLGAIGNSIAGLIGGGIGAQIIGALVGGGTGTDLAGAGGLDIGSIIGQIASGGSGRRHPDGDRWTNKTGYGRSEDRLSSSAKPRLTRLTSKRRPRSQADPANDIHVGSPGSQKVANVEPCQPGSSGGPGSLAAVLRLQLGLAFVGPDRLARFGGLLHLGLRLEDIETFLPRRCRGPPHSVPNPAA